MAGLGRNAHSQQILLLWEVHALHGTCKVNSSPDVVVQREFNSMLTQFVQCYFKRRLVSRVLSWLGAVCACHAMLDAVHI